MAQAMIDSVDGHPAPKRLALGSGTYTSIRAALVDRLAVLDAQKDIAFSTDFDGLNPKATCAAVTADLDGPQLAGLPVTPRCRQVDAFDPYFCRVWRLPNFA